jgi:hypothetical protein
MFEMRLTLFCLFVRLTTGAQTIALHLPFNAEKIADELEAVHSRSRADKTGFSNE